MADTTSTLDQFLDPIAKCLTPDVARRIADLQAGRQTKTRLEDLRVKANEGTLSNSERAEYEELVEGFDLFAILKAKARSVLAKHAP